MKQALILIPDKIQELIEIEKDKLFEAWAARDDGENFSISVGIKLGTDRHGKNVCDISLSFIKEKVKTTTSFTWDDHQLPLITKISEIDQRLKKDGLSMTVSSPGHKPVTLGGKTKGVTVEERDFVTNTIRTIRLGTGEIIEERSMTQEEIDSLPEDPNPFYNPKKEKSDETHS